MVAYGIPEDLVDDHLAMGESQAIECVKCFVVAIVRMFGTNYLRAPNPEHTARLWRRTRLVDFQKFLALLILCTGVGIIVQEHDMDNSKAIRRIPLSSLKPWQITRHGFCMIIWNAWVVQ
jgi:hypothetical protein